MRYRDFFFLITDSLLPAPCSLFPVTCSLKPINLYLTREDNCYM
ncbi:MULTISPECIES: hypothetical protein [unclassified Moorena]|nr:MULTISPECIES: hypothetical protein [unclassified Moorena]